MDLDTAGYSKDGEEQSRPNEFTSSIPYEFWGTETPLRFTAQQFHFHAPSEHSIDGNQMDLEMHTVHFNADEGHLKETGFPDAALSIMFSVANPTIELTDP